MLAKASESSLDDALKTWDICMQVKAFVADGAISDEATARVRDTLLASGDLKTSAPPSSLCRPPLRQGRREVVRFPRMFENLFRLDGKSPSSPRTVPCRSS